MSKTKKRTIWVVIILALILGGYFYFKSKKPKIQYTTAEARRGDLTQTVSVTGVVTSAGQIDLAFQLTGTIIIMNVKVGDSVAKGEKLAEVDKGTLPSQIVQAQADIKYQKEVLDNIKARKSTKDQRDAQRALLTKSEAGLSLLQQQLKDTVIYAPKSGVVVRKNFDLGETVNANVAVISLAGDSDLEIQSKVPESDIVKVAVEQKAVCSFDALSSDEKIETQVSEIEPASTVIQDVVYYIVKLKLPNQDARLKNGMSSDIDIETAMRSNVIMIPLRAVKTDGSTKYVDILNDDGLTTRRANVETGLQGDEGMVEIKSGLSGGEKVVTLQK